ncbi:MAG: oligosaccharide flippase family protein [Acidobacteria bacterium]|nr:oligosaccharide flippase family protein [Acidobacteriota bacterium]
MTTESPVVLRALEKKAIRGAFWSVLEYGSGMGLRVISSLVLTRLLAPVYFGEMTLVTTLIVGINLLSDFGLAPSVIQSAQGDEPVFLNTAWTIQVIRGVALWLIAILISWPMAIFYHDAQLKLLLPVLALSTLIGSFNSTNLLTLSRHLGVRRLFAIDGSTAVVSLVVTIIWAYFWPSVWAIVFGQIVSTIYRLVLSHIPALAPGIRNTFCWDKEALHSIVHFGKWILVGTAFFFFASQADRLILGRLISLTLLGVYGLAYQLSDVPRQIILALGGRVAYPFISKLIHMTMDEFRAKFLHYRFYILLLGAVLLSLMVVWGHLIILLLYDRRYHEAAWMIPILALGLWQTLLYQTTAPVLFALGKPRYNAIGNAGYCIAMLTCLPLAFHLWGMTGAVVAIAAGDLPLYLVVQTGCTREGVKPLWQDLQMTGIFVSILAICFLLRHLF